jgi:hypothetical protein
VPYEVMTVAPNGTSRHSEAVLTFRAYGARGAIVAELQGKSGSRPLPSDGQSRRKLARTLHPPASPRAGGARAQGRAVASLTCP